MNLALQFEPCVAVKAMLVHGDFLNTFHKVG